MPIKILEKPVVVIPNEPDCVKILRISIEAPSDSLPVTGSIIFAPQDSKTEHIFRELQFEVYVPDVMARIREGDALIAQSFGALMQVAEAEYAKYVAAKKVEEIKE